MIFSPGVHGSEDDRDRLVHPAELRRVVTLVGSEERPCFVDGAMSPPHEGGGDGPAQAQFSSESLCFFDPVRLRLKSD